MAIKLTEQSPKRKPKKPEGQTRSGQQRAARQKIRRALGRPAIHRNIDGLLDQIKMRRRLLSHGMGQMRSIIDIRQVPVPQSNQFTFHSKAVGEKGVVHKQVINLYDVGFSDKKDRNHTIKIKFPNNLVKYMIRLRGDILPVQVRCSCLDYYFTWWWYNRDPNKVHAGARMRPYVRKTLPPPEGYPFRNVAHIPGFCKHLLGLVLKLIKMGLLVTKNDPMTVYRNANKK